jgi:hypothetical protein
LGEAIHINGILVVSPLGLLESVHPSLKGKTMSKRPLRAYIVVEPEDGSKQKKSFWHEVGVAWPHKKGEGITVDLHKGLSVSGRIVCATAKAAEKKATDPDGGASFWLSDN